MLKKCLIFLLGLIVFCNGYAALQTEIDRTSVTTNEPITLIITSQDHLNLAPDLAVLQKDFYVIATSQSSQFSMTNGQTSMQTQWRISLMPKHPGELIIPELAVGSEKTQPQVVHVAKDKTVPAKQVAHNYDIFIQTQVSPKETYIQGQFIYTVKLFFNKTIENAYLMAPDLVDAKITQNGQDIAYTTMRKGKLYRVLERTYIIIPLKSGQFQIQPPILRGYLDEDNSVFDMYGFANHAMQPIKIAGSIQQVSVKAKPAHFNGQWLPAKKITIKETWTENPVVYRVGEPSTRILEVHAQAATAEQIPAFVIPSTSDLNIYPEQPQRDTLRNDANSEGTLKQKIVYIPTQRGKVIIPAVAVKWWNLTEQREETTTLPAKTVNVLPALVQTSTKLPVIPNSPTVKTPVPTSMEMVKPTQSTGRQLFHDYLWPILTLLFIFIWILTLILWRWQHKRTPKPSLTGSGNQKEWTRTLQKACDSHDKLLARTAFLEWAKLNWKDKAFHCLADVIPVLALESQNDLIEQIMQLEQAFYGKTKPWQGKLFWDCFSHYQHPKTEQAKDKKDSLPPLYFSQ